MAKGELFKNSGRDSDKGVLGFFEFERGLRQYPDSATCCSESHDEHALEPLCQPRNGDRKEVTSHC